MIIGQVYKKDGTEVVVKGQAGEDIFAGAPVVMNPKDKKFYNCTAARKDGEIGIACLGFHVGRNEFFDKIKEGATFDVVKKGYVVVPRKSLESFKDNLFWDEKQKCFVASGGGLALGNSAFVEDNTATSIGICLHGNVSAQGASNKEAGG